MRKSAPSNAVRENREGGHKRVLVLYVPEKELQLPSHCSHSIKAKKCYHLWPHSESLVHKKVPF